ncbi:MAG TPA: hypothetical protein HA257_00380 [Candidatus Methanoperedenaceae archaeon]|nr:hypothetical protein [Candidatus Methanoperedenaceae archaeon]
MNDIPMLWFNTPKKERNGVLKKIESGTADDAGIRSLLNSIERQPERLPELVESLVGVLKSQQTKDCRQALCVLVNIANKNPESVLGSTEVVIELVRKKEMGYEGLIYALEFLSLVYTREPEKIKTTLVELFSCLRNMNEGVRKRAYNLLSVIAVNSPEVFKGHSIELKRSILGLNTDERVYACRLARILADTDQSVVEDLYEILKDVEMTQHNNELRAEASAVLRKLKVKEEPVMPLPQEPDFDLDKGLIDTQDMVSTPDVTSIAGELPSILTGMNLEKDAVDLLGSMGLGHMIVNRASPYERKPDNMHMLELTVSQMLNSGNIEGALLMTTSAQVLASAGTQITSSILGNISALLAASNDHRSKVSLEWANKKLIAMLVGNDMVLAVVARPESQLGVVQFEMNMFAEKIGNMLAV